MANAALAAAFARDAATMLADWSTVVSSGVTTSGILSQRDKLEELPGGGMQVVGRITVLRVKALSIEPANGDTVTVDGVSYRVDYPMDSSPDGAFTDYAVVAIT
jgi:hypothetical protein